MTEIYISFTLWETTVGHPVFSKQVFCILPFLQANIERRVLFYTTGILTEFISSELRYITPFARESFSFFENFKFKALKGFIRYVAISLPSVAHKDSVTSLKTLSKRKQYMFSILQFSEAIQQISFPEK